MLTLPASWASAAIDTEYPCGCSRVLASPSSAVRARCSDRHRAPALQLRAMRRLCAHLRGVRPGQPLLPAVRGCGRQASKTPGKQEVLAFGQGSPSGSEAARATPQAPA